MCVCVHFGLISCAGVTGSVGITYHAQCHATHTYVSLPPSLPFLPPSLMCVHDIVYVCVFYSRGNVESLVCVVIPYNVVLTHWYSTESQHHIPLLVVVLTLCAVLVVNAVSSPVCLLMYLAQNDVLLALHHSLISYSEVLC